MGSTILKRAVPSVKVACFFCSSSSSSRQHAAEVFSGSSIGDNGGRGELLLTRKSGKRRKFLGSRFVSSLLVLVVDVVPVVIVMGSFQE